MNQLIRLILFLSVDRPIRVALVTLPIVLLAILGIFRINFEDGLRTMFTSDSEDFRNYAGYAQTFTQSETDIAVLISANAPLTGADFTVIEDFILEAQFIGGIGGVYSIFNLTGRDQATGERARLLPADLTDKAALDAALVAATANSANGLSPMSPDLRQTVVVFSLGADMSNLTAPATPLRDLEDLAGVTGSPGGLQFQITGLIPIREGIIAGLKNDQMKINILGAFLGFLLSLAMFRSFWVAIINTVTPVTALIFCLGSFGWLGLSINALTNALPVLILVLASSDAIHLTFDIRRRLGRGEDQTSAIKNAVIDIAPPCVLTSLTTILAFASLFYSGSPIVQDLALAGTAGVFLAMLVVLFVHPCVFALASTIPAVRRALPLIEDQTKARAAGRVQAYTIRNFRTITYGGVALCLGALVILLPIQPEYRFMENIEKTHPVVQVLEQVEQFSGPINSINIPLGLAQRYEATAPEVAEDLAKLTKALGNVPGVRAVVSLNDVRALLADGDGVVSQQELAKTIEAMPQRLRNRLIGADGRSLQVIVMVPDQGSQIVATQAQQMADEIAKLDLRATVAGAPTGFLVMSSSLADDMIGQLTISFLIAALACPALIGFWYGRLDFGLAAIVPNILPIVFAGACLTVFDYDIQITSALALTIAFGIALDDSIHVFNRLHLQTQLDGEKMSDRLINAAMTKVRPVLIVTTVILSAGLFATLISEMPMIRFFGMLCVGTFVMALLSDLILLPAILTWLGRNRGEA